MDAGFEEGVVRFTRKIHRQFEETIRHRDKSEISSRFWDVVVLTASDDDQKTAFELQLRAKLERREIPTGVDYLVFADPPGPKIGCGGATMYAVSRLTEIYGSRLSSMYIMLINAGGMSQRLASASVLGKIFTALPTGWSPPWQVLELKLAAFLPLLANMNPGFLHVASDTIEVYDIGNEETSNWSLTRPGLTALAHPSTVHIGTTHGVFVLEIEPETTLKGSTLEYCKCTRVLQKPSVELLRSSGAIRKTENQEEFVYTDSLFYIDHVVANKLLEFYVQECPLQCELDAYGDFMQSMGENASSAFATDSRNVVKANEHLASTRLRLFECLRNTRLNVLAANASKFYHLGTVNEYLDSFCVDKELARYCGFSNVTYCHFSENLSNKGCLINCFFSLPVNVGTRSILEYCRFESSVDIGDNCIISNCWCNTSQPLVKVPSDLFMHTIPVRVKGLPGVKYVTLVYSINDNMKAQADKVAGEFREKLLFLNKPLSKSVPDNVSGDALFSPDSSGDVVYSLWYARLFPALNSMNESFLAAVSLASGQSLEIDGTSKYTFLSAAEVMASKDVHEMLNYRAELHKMINA